MPYNILDLGLVGYSHALTCQKELLAQVKKGAIGDSIIFCEHKNVFTIGRSGSSKNILCGLAETNRLGIDVISADRGGDVTYHGRGQLIVYPIFDLRKSRKDLHFFLRRLEQLTQEVLNSYDINTQLIDGRRGVWTAAGKIASIGIAVSNWVTYHGLSLNINTDLNFFKLINPCGSEDVKMTSMAKILDKDVDLEDVKHKFCETFNVVFK